MKIDDIEISGTYEFTGRVAEALRMIEKYDGAIYRQIGIAIKHIRPARKSVFNFSTNTYSVADETAFPDVESPGDVMWLASTFIHEKKHYEIQQGGTDWFDDSKKEYHERAAVDAQRSFFVGMRPDDNLLNHFLDHLDSQIETKYWEKSDDITR